MAARLPTHDLLIQGETAVPHAAGNIYKQDTIWKQAAEAKPVSPRMKKFGSMHHWSDVLTTHHNSVKEKLNALNAMIAAQDSETRHVLLSALTEVLRSEKIAKVRRKAIEALGIYFTWSEIEWTWFLHYKRRPEDTETLTIYEWYAQHKKLNRLDVNLLNRGIRELAS
jgi:hypothetical protein